MPNKKILSSLLLITMFSVFPMTGLAAEQNVTEEVDVAGSESFSELNVSIDGKNDQTVKPEVKIDDKVGKNENNADSSTKEDICGFEAPEKEKHSAQLIAVRRQLRVEPEEEFRVKVFMKNTGNMPWFSTKSVCFGPKMSLGTDTPRDRDSQFYAEDMEGWEAANRIAMDGYRADPGEIASFTFWMKASDDADVYKEYFAPVLTGIQWIDEARFSFEILVGDTGESASDIRRKVEYANTSGSIGNIDLNAEKSINVDLSEQVLRVKLGETVVREFRVSTGKPSTPTPVGETKIILKQRVRVGNAAPHYIMPKYMMFRAGGYGFHALPSLGNDGGVFWTEARNHIGIPVSHGCVRILPEDADWLFDFTDVGTKVVVQR